MMKRLFCVFALSLLFLFNKFYSRNIITEKKETYLEKPLEGLEEVQFERKIIKEGIVNYEEIKEGVIDYGEIKEGSSGISVFKISNIGKRSLILMEVKPTCGCT